ncbi:MAG: dTMP kinase [Gammaproteobacteria bacterium]
MKNKMIVIDGVDGSGKGVQTRRLHQALLHSGLQSLLTREPGGSKAAEDIRKLLVEGEPDKWDSMTELLLMYASRRSHLNDTILPALQQGQWVVCDRFADSSRAFQGIAGDLGLDVVENIHQLVVGSFAPDMVLILDIPESLALERALARGGAEDRFEKKGELYQSRVRQAFLQIATSDLQRYQVIDANQPIDEVTEDIFDIVNGQYQLSLELNKGIE